MPIKAKNIVVGVQQTPTPKQESVTTPVSGVRVFGSFINKSAKVEEQKPVTPNPTIKKAVKTVEEPVATSRYIHKEDGELIRHINTKSNYLKDVFDLDS